MSAALTQAVREPLPGTAAGEAPLLRVLTCGSVDDGKSTLLGRLLYDSNAIFDDQLSALDQESRRWGTQGETRDFALLLDELSAEREQGITIDVAYRYFSTPRRSFIIADAPGHDQYTRNMATGASNADLAIILVDARKGVRPQTRRHAFIAATLGIRHAVLAINKMDLVDFSQAVWQRISDEFRAASGSLGFASIVSIPIVARDGDNIVRPSERMPWFAGETLLAHLETVSVEPPEAGGAGRLPVQLVLRPDSEFRGYAGTVAGGTLRTGQEVVVLPGGQHTSICRIVTADSDRAQAGPGEAVTITLANEIDVSRGDVLAAADQAPTVTTQLSARLLWMEKDPLAAGQEFVVQLGTATANAKVTRIRHAIDIETYEPEPAAWLGMNGIGLVDLAFDKEIVAARYAEDRTLGALILVDRLTNRTAGMAVIDAIDGPPEHVGLRWRPSSWSRFSARLLGGAFIWTATVALSRDVALASMLAAADVLLRPALEHIARGRE
ncbi:MAG TPA: GTP-binding protein [Acetobacteraceae bacterium]|nr:GTP-binding protein [Acetobacteraceae bacterium]